MQPDANLIVYQYADAAYQQRLKASWESGERQIEVGKYNGQCFAKLLDTGAIAVFAGSPSKPGPQLWSSIPTPAAPPATASTGAVPATATRSYTSNHPVYIVAHRCNSKDLTVVGGHGVNAIEADFRYGGGARTTGWYIAHDDVLPTSPTLNEWLDSVAAEVRRPGSPLALLYVDIKTPEGPLDEMFDAIQRKLPELYTVYDIGKLKEGKHLAKIKDRILKDSKAVAAMGFDDSPSDVNQFFKDNGYPIHKYWYEIGLAAAFQWSSKEEGWAREAIRARFAGTGPKVAIWTFEKESSVQSWLNEGVDAILVNSSKAYGRTTAFVSDADVHVKNAKALTLPDKYGTPSDNALLDFGPAPRTYAVAIKTADKFGGGTDSNIDLEMWSWKAGQEVYLGKTRLNPMITGDIFVQNTVDNFSIRKRTNMGEVFKVKVTSDGRYPGSAWDLEWIKVDERQFNFNTELDGDSSTREIAKVNSP
jgi:PLAT/LH2 domain